MILISRAVPARLLVVPFIFCACLANSAQAKDINAGSLTNSPPMISYASDGTTLQGMIIDLAAAMSKEMGSTIVFKDVPFPAIIPALESRRIDMSFTVMNDTPEREERMDFVDFYNMGTLLLVRKGNPDHIAGPDSLCGKTVSTIQGSVQLALLAEFNAKCTAAGRPEIQNMQYAQPADARLQVQTGRVSAFFGNAPVMVYIAKTAGDGSIFDVIRDHEYQQSPIGMTVPKANPELRDALQKALAAVIANGTYRKILDKYDIAGGAVSAAVVNAGHVQKP